MRRHERQVRKPLTQPMAGASDKTDEQLMVAFARGQSDAFELLFERYKQPLFGFFRRRLDDAALAEELTQEAFLAVLRGSVRYQATALFRTWLYAIAFNILRAQRRKATWRAVFTGIGPGHQNPRRTIISTTTC